MTKGKKGLKTGLSAANQEIEFEVGEQKIQSKSMKSAYKTACFETGYDSVNVPVPRSVLHIINMINQIIFHSKPHLSIEQVEHGYSETDGEYGLQFWDGHLDEEDPEAVIDPDYYNDLTDVFTRLDANNFYDTVYFDFDRYEILFTDKMDMYKVLHDFIVDPDEPLMTPDSLRFEDQECTDTFEFSDMPDHLSFGDKERLFDDVTTQVQQQFEETQKKYRLGHVTEQWANDTPESDSMFRTVPPRGYLSREDFLDACYHMAAVPLTDSLGHLLKIIMHEDKVEAPGGSYGHFLRNSYGGHH